MSLNNNHDDSNDDLMIFTMDPLNPNDDDIDDGRTQLKSDLSTSDYHSYVTTTETSITVDPSPFEFVSTNKKMFDITDLLGSSPFDDKEEICKWFDKLQPISTSSPSLNLVEYLRGQTLTHDQDIQWQIEQNHLKYDSKQLSPSDYLTRQSLYNRPVAFEKDSRSWARSLLNNFKKTNNKASINYSYIKNSPSFDHHMQFIEHLNECNDYPTYLEYINENRSQLFYTLTDSLDIIDGLLGTVVSSF
ncbi:unnamed protein product [Rotaria socialis]|uniref:Uncharacterized protein n=2 Tax=Rotaria socialis TaxID=392032 RepID=A0A819Z816_9BILA|nr:unnamed protein product [Rotaria socialis]CAF3383450.1 unnamed protein product [Rotaria socialis]CAF3428456.1 unnamed protein product [Rotaria socialis]CAF3431869.1 unnamed protein product [Rotaria socialis]CAF3530306.1 unnamed protein product [Rotaria socialis]